MVVTDVGVRVISGMSDSALVAICVNKSWHTKRQAGLRARALSSTT